MGREEAREEHAGLYQVLDDCVPLPVLGHCEENPEISVVGSRMLGHTLFSNTPLKESHDKDSRPDRQRQGS